MFRVVSFSYFFLFAFFNFSFRFPIERVDCAHRQFRLGHPAKWKIKRTKEPLYLSSFGWNLRFDWMTTIEANEQSKKNKFKVKKYTEQVSFLVVMFRCSVNAVTMNKNEAYCMPFAKRLFSFSFFLFHSFSLCAQCSVNTIPNKCEAKKELYFQAKRKFIFLRTTFVDGFLSLLFKVHRRIFPAFDRQNNIRHKKLVQLASKHWKLFHNVFLFWPSSKRKYEISSLCNFCLCCCR